MQRLHLFPNNKLPENLLINVSNQIQQLKPMPKRLDHYSEEEIKQFPKLIDLPKNYIVR